ENAVERVLALSDGFGAHLVVDCVVIYADLKSA
ncbi:MAG: hypothetical protein JWN14_2057, partial [Chthonomonadales bacterium]|nr:hypothetical protein [Chthonomonadales bacterium]